MRDYVWVWSDGSLALASTCPHCGTSFVEVPRPHDGRTQLLMGCDCFEGAARRRIELSATLRRMEQEEAHK